ncbi:MAG TPA: hypothetical protein PLJ83_01120 [Spirochaetales bacterium]|nr:hypothetical protein [Spirochaetales bacterium]
MKSIVHSSLFLILSLVILSCAVDNTIDQGTVPEWKILGSAGQGASIGNYLDLAVDLNDYPVVAYVDLAHKISVKRWDGTQWVFIGSPAFSPVTTDTVDLALNSLNQPLVAFISNDNRKAMVMQWDGNSWVTLGEGGISKGTAKLIHIALKTDKPIIAFKDLSHEGKLTVMIYE